MRNLRSLLLVSLLGSALACGSSGKAGGGSAGTTGGAGSGTAGAGTAGSGAAGAAGSGGGAGASGTAGVAGTSGAAGSSAGTTGASGASGASGGSGASGATGAAGHDAGAGAGGADAGAGSTDGGVVTGGASKCATGKYLLCEGFEGTAAGAIPTGWTRSAQGPDSLIGVDDKESARGAHAIKMNAIPSGYRMISHPATAFGAAHWGRIFYKVQVPAPKTTTYVHSDLVQFTAQYRLGGSIEQVRVVDTVQAPNGKHQFLYDVDLLMLNQEFSIQGPYNWMYDGAWHCAEWHLDSTNQSYHFYFDGKEVTEMAKVNGAGNFAGTEIPSTLQTLDVGWQNFQTAGTGFVAWIDEIAIDSARIGCAN